MAFVSVTRLRVRALRHLPRFAWLTIRARGQMRRAPGFRGGSLLADGGRVFWTMSAWDDRASAHRYTTTGPHRAAMPWLAAWCDEASVVHWEQPTGALPTWPEADRRMRAQGRPSRVRAPSPDHAGLTYRAPRTMARAAVGPAGER